MPKGDKTKGVVPTDEFTYRGRVYVRPMERGVKLLDAEGELDMYLDNAATLVATGSMFGDGYAELEIIIRRIKSEDAAESADNKSDAIIERR